MVQPNPNLPAPPFAASPSGTFEVMVPCFLKVTVRGDDEFQAEMTALDAVRELGSVDTPRGTVVFGTMMTPVTQMKSA